MQDFSGSWIKYHSALQYSAQLRVPEYEDTASRRVGLPASEWSAKSRVNWSGSAAEAICKSYACVVFQTGTRLRGIIDGQFIPDGETSTQNRCFGVLRGTADRREDAGAN